MICKGKSWKEASLWRYPVGAGVMSVVLCIAAIPFGSLPAMAVEANAAERFSGTRAMEYLEAICEFGPRPSGSIGMQKQREFLIRYFQKAGAKVFRQAFRSRDGRTGE